MSIGTKPVMHLVALCVCSVWMSEVEKGDSAADNAKMIELQSIIFYVSFENESCCCFIAVLSFLCSFMVLYFCCSYYVAASSLLLLLSLL